MVNGLIAENAKGAAKYLTKLTQKMKEHNASIVSLLEKNISRCLKYAFLPRFLNCPSFPVHIFYLFLLHFHLIVRPNSSNAFILKVPFTLKKMTKMQKHGIFALLFTLSLIIH